MDEFGIGEQLQEMLYLCGVHQAFDDELFPLVFIADFFQEIQICLFPFIDNLFVDVLEENEYGGTVKIIVSDKTPSNLSSGIFTLKQGEALIPDIHQSDEVFYVLSGILTLRDGEKTEEQKSKLEVWYGYQTARFNLSSNENEEDVVILWTFACS